MEALGSRCFPCNEDKNFENGLFCNANLPSPALSRQLESNKEELRQTILKQEVLFIDQVQELHRLYQRQTELMSKVEKQQLHKQSYYAVKMSHKPRDLDLISTRLNNLIDLNEPYQVEESRTTNSVDSLDPSISQGEIPGRDPSAKTNSDFGVLFTESFGNSATIKNLDACSMLQEQPPCTNEAGENSCNSATIKNLDACSMLQEQPPCTNEAGHSSTVVDFQLPLVSYRGRPRHHLERSPIVVLALPVFNAPPPFNRLPRRSIARSRHTSKKLHLGGSSTCSRGQGAAWSKVTSQGSRFESMTSSTDHDFSPGHQAHKEHLKGSDMMDVKSDRDTHLNSISPGFSAEMVSQQQSCTMDKHIQSEENCHEVSVAGGYVVAPISPENQECSRPRGESEESLLDLSQGKGTGPLEKPDSIPAHEPVFTSSSGIEACLESDIWDLSNALPNNTLDWFATVCLDPNTEYRLVSGNNCAKREGLSSDEVDYFEAMTLRLTELRSADQLAKTSSQAEGTCPTIFLSRAKNGPCRGRQQKGFQREILLSLPSPAMHEVAEDLDTMGGLVIASGSPPGTKSARGRKRVRASVLDAADNTLSMPLKQPAATPDTGSQGRWLTGWGNVRHRSQRHRSSNSSLLTHFSWNDTMLP